MVKRHLKRLAIPNTWDVKKKGITFITRPKPGAHPFGLGMPLNIVMRDLLNYAHNTREVKKIIYNKDVLIDGKVRKDHRFITGFMDIISMPKIKENYRLSLNKKGKLILLKIDDAEAKTKVCKITGKSNIKGKLQLNLFDAKNILVKKDVYKVGDSIAIELPSFKIKNHFKMDKGASVFIIGGKKIGIVGTIEDILGRKVICKHKEGMFEVPFKYVFVIGKDKPSIKIEL